MNQQAERDQQRLRAFLLRAFALDPGEASVDMVIQMLTRFQRDDARLLAFVEQHLPVLPEGLAARVRFESATAAAILLLKHFLGELAPEVPTGV